MAGSDTFRGCSFQAAYCVGLALDVLEGAGTTLVLEGNADVVDAAIETAEGLSRVTQAKTKREPSVWQPQQVADVIRAWLDSTAAAAERFEFVTDGSLGSGVTRVLAPALHHIGTVGPTPEEREQLEALGLDPDAPALGRISLSSRLPDGRTLLERETLRVLELRERGERVTVEQARDLVARLFAKVVLDSGEPLGEERRLERAAIAELVGVPLDAVEGDERWSPQLEDRYRAALAATPLDPAWTLLSLVMEQRPDELVERHVVKGGEERSATIPVTELLKRSDDVAIQGPAGAGKTTTLAQLRTAALTYGLLPIHQRLGAYTAGTIEQLLRRSLERALEHPLAPGALRGLLMRRDVLVLLDGVGELIPEQRSALLDDLIALRDRHAGARFMIAARDGNALKRLAPTAFTLQGLDKSARRSIASKLAPASDERLVAEIEQRLGDIVSNPLLFTLALVLTTQGMRVDSRATLFDGFVSRLQARSEGAVLSAATRAGAEVACWELRQENRYSADRWWWLDRFTEVRDELIARGTIGSDALTADRQLAELEALGLMRSVSESDFELGLLHDLFCDWLAAEAIRHGRRTLPDPVPAPLEEAVVFLAERGVLDPVRLLAIAGNAVAASRVADTLPDGELDPELVEALWQRLRGQLAPSLATPLETLRLHVVDDARVWACLTAGDDSRPSMLAMNSPIICFPARPISSLSVAVDVWLAVLRLELQETAVGPPPPRRPAADIVELLRDTTNERGAIVEEMAAGLFAPGLAERLVWAVGPTGLRAWLAPAKQGYGDPPGTLSHSMWYMEKVEGFHVERDVERETIPFERAGSMSAESYAKGWQYGAARERIIDGLTELIPRYRA